MSDSAGRKSSKRLTRLLTVAVLGLLAVTFLGRFGRYWWPVDLPNHLAVYLACFAVVLTCICLVFRRWRFAVVAVAATVFYLFLIYPQLIASPPPPPSIDTQYQLRLAHLNVLRPNRDEPGVVAFLNNCDADAVFIQEASPWWVDTLRAADIPYHETVSQTGDGRFGIMMLMRDDDARIAERDVQLVFSRILDVVSKEIDRPAIEAVFTVNGQEVSVLSVHPAHPVSAELTNTRDRMLRAAKNWANKQTTPHIIIGDFNTTPWSYAFSIMDADGQMISTLDGRGNQGTIRADFPLPLLVPIDHCLHSTDMYCLERTVGPYVGSDHLPLCVTLALDPQAVQPAFDNQPSQDQFTIAQPE